MDAPAFTLTYAFQKPFLDRSAHTGYAVIGEYKQNSATRVVSTRTQAVCTEKQIAKETAEMWSEVVNLNLLLG